MTESPRTAPERRYFPSQTRRERLDQLYRDGLRELGELQERLTLRRLALGLPPAPRT